MIGLHRILSTKGRSRRRDTLIKQNLPFINMEDYNLSVGDASKSLNDGIEDIFLRGKKLAIIPPIRININSHNNGNSAISVRQASRYEIDATSSSITYTLDGTLFLLNSGGDVSSLNSSLSRHCVFTGGYMVNTADSPTSSIGIRAVSFRDLTIEGVEFEGFHTALSISGRDTYYIDRCFFRSGTFGIHLPDDISDSADNNLMIFITRCHFSNPDTCIWIENNFRDLFIHGCSFNFAFQSNKTGILIENKILGTPAFGAGVSIRNIHFDPATNDSVGIHIKGAPGGKIRQGEIVGVTSAFNGTNNTLIKLESVGNFTLDQINTDNTAISDDQTFSTTDVSIANDEIALTSHGLLTGDIISFSSTGTLPAGLDGRFYRTIKSTDDIIKVARSYEDANSGAAIEITGTGTGTHTLAHHSSIPLYIDEDCESITIGPSNIFTTGPIDYRCDRNEIHFSNSLFPVRRTLPSFNAGVFTSGTQVIDMYSELGTSLPNHRDNVSGASELPHNIPPKGYQIILSCQGDGSAANATQVFVANVSSGSIRSNSIACITTDLANDTVRTSSGYVSADQNGDLFISHVAGGGTNITIWLTVLAIIY